MPKKTTSESPFKRIREGQALVEYTLIFILVIVAFVVAMAATGPAIGNVFSNTVYNLLGLTTTPRAIGDVEDFWLTVTWVATQTPQEFPLPTRTLPPPSQAPTAGPSPTATPITPTKTPVPTITPGPTNTPVDFSFTAPFEDRIDNPEWWRIDKSIFLGSEDWLGKYYPNMTLSGTPDVTEFNAIIDPDTKSKIYFPWGYGGPIDNWPTGHAYEQFSVKWTRRIYLPNATTLTFTLASDDGSRLWLDYEDGCSSTGINSGSSNTTVYTQGDPSTDCLLISSWRDQGTTTRTATRTIPAGFHTLQVDYYENGGGANVVLDILDVNQSANVDDTSLSGGIPDCNWGLHGTAGNTNTKSLMWEEYVNGDFPRNMRCYLEFRGSVSIPASMANPEFSFWDIWDFRNTSLGGWLEIAEYLPPGDPGREAPGYWKRIDLHIGSTTNYNWTRHVVDLSNVGGVNFLGKDLTWRFVMENGNYTDYRRWYIDDINIVDKTYNTYYPGMIWNLNTVDQKDDFIGTGRWDLTDQNKRGASGMSWDDSPNAPGESYAPGNWQSVRYDTHNEWTSLDMNIRIHSLEFNGWIDLTDVAGAADLEGDTGKAMLSFWQAYYIGSKAYLEIQYTTDPYGVAAPNWQVVPSADPTDPYGAILPYEAADRQNLDLTFAQVALDQIPATRFRLRFALIVPYGATTRDGWWIDDIYLEREGKPKYTTYPLFDDAESGTDKWMMGGTWDRTNTTGVYNSEHSFTDSPTGNYNDYSGTSMMLKYPFDLNNDTPSNPKSTTCNLGGDCTSDGVAAVSPMMTFWHWRRINDSNDGFYVEWRRWSDEDLPENWHPIWAYIYGMNTLNSSTSSRTRIQLGWERVLIDLTPIQEAFDPDPTNYEDDDVLIRIRMYGDSSGNDDGIYIDNISIDERVESVFKLWPTGENRGGLGLGNGTSLIDDVDTPGDWWTRWWNGGGWESIDWEQHGGLNAFHDSVRKDGVVQIDAPPNEDPSVAQLHQVFSVLEMQKIVDLRGVDISEAPTLYFWSRYYTGSSDYLRVEVSVENTALTAPCGYAGLDQCYEHQRGWSEWTKLWEVTTWKRTYTWQREQVALDTYVGKRVKIRFVSDSLESDNNRDGWYIDDITIKYRNPPRLYPLPFTDEAQNLGHWITEGIWGLSPEKFRGSGGGPASLGSYWRGYWWYCSTCWSASNADSWMTSHPNNESPDGTEVVLDINHDPGYGDLFCYDADPTICRSDRVAARWELETPVVGAGLTQPGDYTFITISDDGVRLKYDTMNPSGGVPPANRSIISNWTTHGRTVDMATATLNGGNRYKFTLEYFESGSKAVIILTTGSNSFSFTDSPKQGAGPGFDDVPAVPRGNSSLLLNGLLDLTTAAAPVMEYYTYHNLGGTARVEISPDGGFCWGEECISDYRSKMSAGWTLDDPFYGGTYLPANGDWRRKQHDLSSFAGDQIGLRFRLDRTGTDSTYIPGNDGWWFVDIRILDP